MNSTLSMCVCGLFLSSLVFLVFVLVSSRHIKDREKSSPFECGFDPKNSSRIPFSMRFFLLAVIFLVFDLEIVLLIPVIVYFCCFKGYGGLFSGFLFVFLLWAGTVYEWWEGSFSWIY